MDVFRKCLDSSLALLLLELLFLFVCHAFHDERALFIEKKFAAETTFALAQPLLNRNAEH